MFLGFSKRFLISLLMFAAVYPINIPFHLYNMISQKNACLIPLHSRTSHDILSYHQWIVSHHSYLVPATDGLCWDHEYHGHPQIHRSTGYSYSILFYIILYYSIGNQSYHPVVDHDFNDEVDELGPWWWWRRGILAVGSSCFSQAPHDTIPSSSDSIRASVPAVIRCITLK